MKRKESTLRAALRATFYAIASYAVCFVLCFICARIGASMAHDTASVAVLAQFAAIIATLPAMVFYMAALCYL